jgi:hypothetical protein
MALTLHKPSLPSRPPTAKVTRVPRIAREGVDLAASCPVPQRHLSINQFYVRTIFLVRRNTNDYRTDFVLSTLIRERNQLRRVRANSSSVAVPPSSAPIFGDTRLLLCQTNEATWNPYSLCVNGFSCRGSLRSMLYKTENHTPHPSYAISINQPARYLRAAPARLPRKRYHVHISEM